MVAILEFGNLDSAILVFPFTVTHPCQIGSHHLHKNTSLILSDSTWWWQPSWILSMLDWDTAILDSDTLLSSFRFTQKHCHSTLTLTQTNSIWLKLIHSPLLDEGSHLEFHSSWIWPWWIQPILAFSFKLTQTCQDWFPPSALKHFTHSFSLKLMIAAILNSTMLDSDTAILDSDTLLSSL